MWDLHARWRQYYLDVLTSGLFLQIIIQNQGCSNSIALCVYRDIEMCLWNTAAAAVAMVKQTQWTQKNFSEFKQRHKKERSLGKGEYFEGRKRREINRWHQLYQVNSKTWLNKNTQTILDLGRAGALTPVLFWCALKQLLLYFDADVLKLSEHLRRKSHFLSILLSSSLSFNSIYSDHFHWTLHSAHCCGSSLIICPFH